MFSVSAFNSPGAACQSVRPCLILKMCSGFSKGQYLISQSREWQGSDPEDHGTGFPGNLLEQSLQEAVSLLLLCLRTQLCQLFAAPWTVAHQAPLSMGFSRQEHWRGHPFPSPGHLPDPGIEPGSPALQAGSLSSEPPGNWTGCWGVTEHIFLEMP